MINKTFNEKKLSLGMEISQKYNLNELTNIFKSYITLNNEYIAHILMIGSFSSGKSALLNKYIGRDILSENQTPETAVATELRYSVKEHITANYMDGSKKEITPSDSIDTDIIKNIVYYVNSENIKNLSDYILVDTPGFDSGIEKHNKALMQYIDNGTAFLLVIDCENGTVSESTISFLYEVAGYSPDVAIILNKCDKKPPEETEAIKEHISAQISGIIGSTLPIVSTSIHYPDVSKHILSMIDTFNPQRLYDKNISLPVSAKIKELTASLETLKSNAKCNTDEIDAEIKNREIARDALIKKIKHEQIALRKRLKTTVKENILSDVENELLQNIDGLADACEGGERPFKERVMQIIRPVIVNKIESEFSLSYDKFIENISIKMPELNIKDEDILSDILSKLRETNILDLMHMNSFQGKKAPSDNSHIYTLITSALAVATDILAKPLELFIMFLPEIFNFVSKLFGDNKKEKLKESIRSRVIPEITEQLRSSLDKTLSELEGIIIENTEMSINHITTTENEALASVLQKKSVIENDYDNFIKAIDDDIKMLEDINEQRL